MFLQNPLVLLANLHKIEVIKKTDDAIYILTDFSLVTLILLAESPLL